MIGARENGIQITVTAAKVMRSCQILLYFAERDMKIPNGLDRRCERKRGVRDEFKKTSFITSRPLG